MGQSQQSAPDAVDWFVKNESDGEPDHETLGQWEMWCSDSRNLEEYEDVVQMWQQLRMMPAPSPVSRRALVEDWKAERMPERASSD